jgi:hypothetical protein
MLTLACTAVLVMGCASPPEVQDVDPERSDQVVVFGQVVFLKDGKPQNLSAVWEGIEAFRLLVLAGESEAARVFPVAMNGRFFWGMTPGKYTLLGYEYNAGGGITANRLWLHFTVPPRVKSAYLGALHIITAQGRCAVGVKDDFDAAVSAYRMQFPAATDSPVKRLMHPTDELGECGQVRHICAAGWGIECTDRYRGITPTAPEVSTLEPTQIDSLLPRFSWQGSTEPEVTYDLVVFEAARYPRGSTTRYMRGRPVAYVQGLERPEFQLQSPLKPGTRHFWSVRLRRGETVSSWSSYSYFHFFLVAWTRGYGHWFSFVTPSQQ